MAQLFLILITLFGPALGEWFKKLLDRLLPEMTGGLPASSALAIHEAFAAARAKLTLWDRWWHGRGVLLNVAERIALERADEIHAAAVNKTAPRPTLTTSERRALMGNG